MNRLLAARPILRSLVSSNVAPLQRMYHDPADRPASYNDLPHPEGKWEDNYGLKQRKYNAALAGSAIFLVGTILYIRESGVLFFNAFAPDTYE